MQDEAVILQSELEGQERELEKLYIAIGKMVLEFSENELRSVNRLVDSIIEKRLQLSKLGENEN